MVGVNDREIQCRRRVNDGKDRCPWRGTRDELVAHTAETREAGDAHQACAVCRQSLADGETRNCSRCVTRVAEALAEIVDAYATLPSVVERAGWHGGALPGGTALVLLAGGSIEGGGPDDHPQFRDPIPVLPELHAWERDWRETFGHDHFPAWQATVVTTVGYLRTWLWLAARTHDAFDDFAHEIHQVRHRLMRVTGLANDPMIAPVECFDCGGRLERSYEDKGGLADEWSCASCGLVYDQAAYFLALRANVLDSRDWVPISAAAHATDQPVQRIRNWVDRLQVGAACRVYERVTVVWWPDVLRRSGRREVNQQEAS